MAKEKVETGESIAVVFPEIDENGFQKVMSGEGEIVYAKYTDKGGCEKRVIIIEDGAVVSDTTEFKPRTYIRAWTRNGVPYRYELMKG